MASIRTSPKPWPSPLVERKSPPVLCRFPAAVKLVQEIYSWVPFMSIYTRMSRSSSGRVRLASMALSKRLPRMTHRSSSEMFSFTGTLASARTGMPLDRAREILLLRMASAMGLPVFTAVSTVARSVSKVSR